MAEARHLNNAPIAEAIIDFRVKLPSEFKVDTFLELKKTIGYRFPKVQERKLFSGQLRFKEEKPPQPSAEYHGVRGYFFKKFLCAINKKFIPKTLKLFNSFPTSNMSLNTDEIPQIGIDDDGNSTWNTPGLTL
jgi:hypothetical protein